MLYFLKMTNPMVYDLYMDGEDPDNFTPKTIDFSHMDTNGELISSIKSNERAIPLAALMYVSFMLDEYGDETFNAQGTKEENQKAADLLGDTINRIIAGGGTVSQELQDTYTRLQENLALYNDLESLCSNVREAAGYKVYIATNKAMTRGLKVIAVKGKNKKSRTIKNLKKGTRYYVEVRAIRMKGKTEYTGSSATKSAKAK